MKRIETSLTNVSGRWQGYYTQNDQERPIEVVFSQEGVRLSGRMEDACTEFRASLADMVIEEGLVPGADERILEAIRSSFPDVPDGPIVAEVRISKQSSVEGQVEGPSIRFLKTNEGPYFSGFRIGDIRLGVMGQDQEVEYFGRLSCDGREIEGRWHLSQHLHPLWHARSEGGFYLRRAEHSEN